MSALTDADRQARDTAAVDVIAATLDGAPGGLPSSLLALLVVDDLRHHGLFDHACDDLCGTDDDHHVCGEDGRECDDACVCHGYSNDADDEDEGGDVVVVAGVVTP